MKTSDVDAKDLLTKGPYLTIATDKYWDFIYHATKTVKAKVANLNQKKRPQFLRKDGNCFPSTHSLVTIFSVYEAFGDMHSLIVSQQRLRV